VFEKSRLPISEFTDEDRMKRVEAFQKDPILLINKYFNTRQFLAENRIFKKQNLEHFAGLKLNWF
jgi:hypothetical protein